MTLASQLCNDCGLCCDGAMFSSVSLQEACLATAREHGLPVVPTREAYQLELPCAALRGVLCGIYEERPECCSDFSCALVLRVDQGKVSLDRAKEVIKKTRAIRSRVTAAVGTKPWWLAHRSALEAERSNPGWARDNARLLADLKALKKLFDRYFWGS